MQNAFISLYFLVSFTFRRNTLIRCIQKGGDNNGEFDQNYIILNYNWFFNSYVG